MPAESRICLPWMITFMGGNLRTPAIAASSQHPLTPPGCHATEPRLFPSPRSHSRQNQVIASVSRRYAKALWSLGLETGEHEKLGESLESVVRAIAESSEARTLAQNPGYTQAQRQQLVDVLAQRLGLSATLVSFLRLLVDRHRLGQLSDIARSYRDLLDAQVGRVRGMVTSASPLPAEELERVRKALSETTRKSLVLEARTDPAILGGVVAQVGPTVWDGSLKTQLERLRKELKDAPLQ